MDFVSNAFPSGRWFRILTIVDDFDRSSPRLEPGVSVAGRHIADVLEQLREATGSPRIIVVDNVTEFTSRAMLDWGYQRRAPALHFSGQARPESLRGIV